MANTSSPSTSIFYELSKNPNNENVICQEPSAAGSSLNNRNIFNKIQYQPQMGSRNKVAPTQPIIISQLSQTSSIDKISTYQIWSILNIIFCCLSAGCIACWYSSKTKRLKKECNIQAALKASEKSRHWNVVSTICGIITMIPVVSIFYFSRV